MHDELNIPPLYFGNDSQQTRIIESLEKQALQRRTKLNIVSGGPASGKSKTLEYVREQLESSGQFETVVTADQITDGRMPRSLPPELAELLSDMNEGQGLYVQHDVYKARTPGASGKPYYVVVADGETPLTNRNAQHLLAEAARLVQDGKKPYDLLWMADVPILQQGVSIFKPGHPAQHELGRHRAAMEELEKHYGKAITVHTLKYDPSETRDAIWKAVQDNGQDAISALAQTTHHPRDDSDKLYWKKACDAALCGDKKGYDSAMRVLAGNTRLAPGLGESKSA
jgi:hypothetical protein